MAMNNSVTTAVAQMSKVCGNVRIANFRLFTLLSKMEGVEVKMKNVCMSEQIDQLATYTRHAFKNVGTTITDSVNRLDNHSTVLSRITDQLADLNDTAHVLVDRTHGCFSESTCVSLCERLHATTLAVMKSSSDVSSTNKTHAPLLTKTCVNSTEDCTALRCVGVLFPVIQINVVVILMHWVIIGCLVSHNYHRRVQLGSTDGLPRDLEMTQYFPVEIADESANKQVLPKMSLGNAAAASLHL